MKPSVNRDTTAIFFCLFLCICSSCSVNPGDRSSFVYGNLCISRAELIILLLSEPEVQIDLDLRQEQIAEIESVLSQKFQAIPNVTNTLYLARTAEGLKSYADLVSQAGEQLDEYWLSSIFRVLEPNQLERLHQVIRQVEGITSLIHNSNIIADLALSAKQKRDIRSISESYSAKRNAIVRRLARQLIAGVGYDETLAGREIELQQLSDTIHNLDADREKELYELLNKGQMDKWHFLLGRPLSITWQSGGPPLLMYH